jgi:hypothetical protein
MVMREKSRVLLLLDPEAAGGIRLKDR